MLVLIGMGINGDLTINGIEEVKKAEEVFYDSYTSVIEKEWIKRIKEETGKEAIPLEREKLESRYLIEKAKKGHIALLVAGDPLSATTHITLVIDGKKEGIKTKVIHNSSIFSAAPGRAGLQHYRFGKTATIVFPRENYKPKYPKEVIEENLSRNLHTLLLLDIDKEMGPMDAKTALEIISEWIPENKEVIVLSRIGMDNERISYGRVKKLLRRELGLPPFSIIIPAKLHPVEEEYLQFFKVD